MTHEEQVQNIKKALESEVFIKNTNAKLNDLSAQSFKSKPQPPSPQKATYNEPPITPTTKFNWKMALIPTAILAVLFFPTAVVWFFVYYFVIYKKQRNEEIEKIKNSTEYKQQCDDAKAEFEAEQKRLDDEYEKAKSHYDNITLPQYNNALDEWTAKHNAEIDDIKNTLEKAKADLAAHYEQTKIVPLQYRNITALRYIYDMISTSDYDVRAAIENYDKSRQRSLEAARIAEQQKANQLIDEQNQLAYEQNELLSQQNDIAEKARRDANIASVVGTVQRHNTNKNLKKLGRK
ncbi:MAG: hypothetical protein ACI396_04580 [Acutalibacteraceae bacterium]